MSRIRPQAIVPALVVIAGVAAVAYGALYHAVPVLRQELEERMVEEQVVKTIQIPVPVMPGDGEQPLGNPPGGPGSPPGAGPWLPTELQPGEKPPAGPAPPGQDSPPGGPPPPSGMRYITQSVTVTERTMKLVPVTNAVEELEPVLVRAVTVGDILRNESGQLGWTNGVQTEGPALCPT
jgi:hypothetical protein